MTTNRIAASLLSLFLLVLLGWSVFAGAGDFRTQVMLGIGVALGLLYAVYGRVPDWIVGFTGGSITQDDDPSNLPARVYLPVLFGVFLVAVIVFLVGVFVM